MQHLENSIALENLIRLQELEDEQTSLQELVQVAPEESEKYNRELEQESEKVDSARQSIEGSQKNRKQLENDVEDLRQKLTHYKGQLMEVKTNEAYQAMLHEIDFVEKRISEKEDQILEEMLEAEELNENLQEAEARYQKRKHGIEEKQRELQQSVAEAEKKLASLEDEKLAVAAQIPGEFMKKYERIAAARGGTAMASVAGHSCSACHVRLRPQLLAEIKSNKQIILCENCNRILYHPS